MLIQLFRPSQIDFSDVEVGGDLVLKIHYSETWEKDKPIAFEEMFDKILDDMEDNS